MPEPEDLLNAPFLVRLTVAEKNMLTAIAKRERRSMNDVVRLLIRANAESEGNLIK